jgi:hypothetical protein
MAIRYWLGVVHRDHVQRAVSLGVAQLNHGSREALRRMGESDGLVYYSPREYYPDGPLLRELTAIGRIADDEIYQAQDEDGSRWRPWRRRVDYDLTATNAPIRPLVPVLDLSRNDPNWGYQLRKGLVELSKHDFETIVAQMRATPPPPSRRVISGWDVAAGELPSTGDRA